MRFGSLGVASAWESKPKLWLAFGTAINNSYTNQRDLGTENRIESKALVNYYCRYTKYIV